jgi:hypothetical protein
VTETQTRPAADEDPLGGISFNTGFGKRAVDDRAREQKAKAAARALAAGNDRPPYLKVEPGEDKKVIIRFLSDIVPVASNPVPWITVAQHSGLEVLRPKPAGYKGTKWPTSMGAVCRHDPMFSGRYSNCYPCDEMIVKSGPQAGKPERPSNRTWALAVLREEVVGTQAMADAGHIKPEQIGQTLGVTTKRREEKVVDKDGKETGEVRMVPELVLLNYGEKNFFGAVSAASGRYGTILDRDLEIERFGTGTNTDYRVSPIPEMFVPDPDDETKQVKLDLRDPRLMLAMVGPKLDADGKPVLWSAEDPITNLPDGTSIAGQVRPNLPDLRYVVAEQASDRHHGRFFDPSYQRDDETPEEGKAGQAAPPPAAAAADVPSDALAGLKARVHGYAGAQGAAEQPGQDAAAPATYSGI